jgi:hypothetical protein
MGTEDYDHVVLKRIDDHTSRPCCRTPDASTASRAE